MIDVGDPVPSAGPSILVCGWAGAGNVGDELLTDWVVDEIEAAGGRVLLTTRSFDDTRVRHPSVTPVRWGAGDLRAARRVDGICVGPGGIIQDNTSIWSLPGHLTKAAVGRLRGIPVAGVGLGAEPLARRSSGWLLRRVLGDAVGVAVRDDESARALAATGVPAVVGADLVFALDPLDPARVDSERGVVVAIGPTIRPGRVAPVARRLDTSAVEDAARAVGALARRVGARVTFAPFRGAPDVELGRALVDQLGARARLLPPEAEPIRAAIAGARVVVSARYHATVLAVAAGVPVLVRSDQTKLSALAAQVADDDRVRLLPSWSAVAEAEVPDRHPAGFRPASVGPHRDVLGRLVDTARHRSG